MKLIPKKVYRVRYKDNISSDRSIDVATNSIISAINAVLEDDKLNNPTITSAVMIDNAHLYIIDYDKE